VFTTYEIPLQGISQTFTINLAGTNYTLTVKWNDSNEAGWVLDIADANQNPIVCGLPLITGLDILAGLNYLGIGGALYVYTNGDQSAVPTFTNLGTDCNLYFQVQS
jgi:hypothetical protein